MSLTDYNEIDEMLERVRPQALTLVDLIKLTNHFQLGDKVNIPIRLLWEYNNADYPEGMNGYIVQVCTHHIVFKLETGLTRSLQRIDCLNVSVTEASNFESYSEEMSISDVIKALEGENRNE